MDPSVTYAGWVYKEGSLVKNWKKRFLVVKRRELAYYKTTDHTSSHAQLMGSMRVSRVEKAGGITNGLLIHSAEGRLLKIFMDTAAERDRCYEAIAEWCQPSEVRSSQSGAVSNAPDRNSIPSTAERVSIGGAASGSRMAGWLEKQGQNMPTWKRRYFVLEDGVLTYSTDEGSTVLGRHRVLGLRRDRTRPFTLELTLDTGRELRVSALDEHNLGEWQRAIMATLQHSPVNRASENRPFEQDPRSRFAEDGPEDSFNLFGAPPLAVSPRRQNNMSFGQNIRLEFDGENTSFIECALQAEPVDTAPKPKPFSPKAPGAETIRKMRIEQKLLDEDDDDLVVARVSSTRPSTGPGSPVPSRRPPSKQEAPPGGCCCVLM